MEPYEILEELNKTTFQSPFTELKTLSDLVAELRTYWAESQNSKRAWYLVDLWDNLLLSKLHIGLFLAAKDGKPLEVPNSQCEEEVQKSCACANGCECYLLELRYNVAQKEVIFEGWEVLEQDSETVIVSNDYYVIVFSLVLRTCSITTKESFTGNDWRSYVPTKTLSKLAEATQSNPLKLK